MIKKLKKFTHSIAFIELCLVMLVSYIWETIEHYLEEQGLFVDWFQGVEFWANRLIFDGLFVAFGYFFIKKYQNFITPARIFSFAWLFIHIVIFPHSMYLHEIFPLEIPYLWGDKTNHLLDFWSIEHFFTGMGIGYAVIKFCEPYAWEKIKCETNKQKLLKIQ